MRHPGCQIEKTPYSETRYRPAVSPEIPNIEIRYIGCSSLEERTQTGEDHDTRSEKRHTEVTLCRSSFSSVLVMNSNLQGA
jgi:hypothetical protein